MPFFSVQLKINYPQTHCSSPSVLIFVWLFGTWLNILPNLCIKIIYHVFPGFFWLSFPTKKTLKKCHSLVKFNKVCTSTGVGTENKFREKEDSCWRAKWRTSEPLLLWDQLFPNTVIFKFCQQSLTHKCEHFCLRGLIIHNCSSS